MTELLCGFDTGRLDSNGKPIKCGDTIEFYEFKEGYTERYSEDGWGRQIRLCRHDQYKVPNKESTIRGVVTYSSQHTGFVVQFDEYMLNTSRDEQLLYILLLSAFPNEKKNKLTVVPAYQYKKDIQSNGTVQEFKIPTEEEYSFEDDDFRYTNDS
jgi:hypothetical protein